MDSAEFVAALLDPARKAPAGLRAWNGSDPLRRFDVHRNNVFASMAAALGETFRVTQAMVGEEFFKAMTAEFTRQSPPRSRLLVEHGCGFPDFIAAFPPASGLRFLPDLARLEWLRVESYHAADMQALDAEAFRPLLALPERLLALRLRLHPASRRLSSAHAVFSLWSAHQDDSPLDSVEPDRPEDVLILRPEHEVRVLRMPPGAAIFFDALVENSSLAEAAVAANTITGFDLADNLRALIAEGLVVGFDS
jgi:hypothetical protein